MLRAKCEEFNDIHGHPVNRDVWQRRKYRFARAEHFPAASAIGEIDQTLAAVIDVFRDLAGRRRIIATDISSDVVKVFSCSCRPADTH